MNLEKQEHDRSREISAGCLQHPITNIALARPICWGDAGNVPAPVFRCNWKALAAQGRAAWGIGGAGPAVLGRKISGRSMKRIRTSFGGSEAWIWAVFSVGPLGELGRNAGGKGRGKRELTWSCQEAERRADQAGNRGAARVPVHIMNGTESVPPTQIKQSRGQDGICNKTEHKSRSTNKLKLTVCVSLYSIF